MMPAVIKDDLDPDGDQQQCCQRDHQAEGGAGQAGGAVEIKSLAISPRLLPYKKTGRPCRQSAGEKQGQLDRKLINHPPGGACPERGP